MDKPLISPEDAPYIKEWLNCREVDIDADGDVWVADPMVGHWLRDERKLEYVAWREAQHGSR